MSNNYYKVECGIPQQVVSDFFDKIFGFFIKKVNDIETAQNITQVVMKMIN